MFMLLRKQRDECLMLHLLCVLVSLYSNNVIDLLAEWQLSLFEHFYFVPNCCVYF